MLDKLDFSTKVRELMELLGEDVNSPVDNFLLQIRSMDSSKLDQL